MIQKYTTQTPQMDPVADLLLSEHPVAYRVSFARVVGGAVPTLLLSQMYYWSNNKTALERSDNSFYMTQDEITEQTGLTRTETETARKKLREAGVLIEEKRGLPMKIWYRLDKNRLYALLSLHVQKRYQTPVYNLGENLQDGAFDDPTNLAENMQDEARERNTQSCGNPTTLNAVTLQDITEIPAETSPSILTETTTTQTLSAKTESVPISDTFVVDPIVKNTNNLVLHGVDPITANLLARQYPDQIANQLVYLPYRDPKDNAAVLVSSIKDNWSAPQPFLDAQVSISRRERVRSQAAESNAKLVAEQEERDARKAEFEKTWEALSHEKRGDLERQTWQQMAQSGGPVASRAKDVLRGDLKASEAMIGKAVRSIYNITLERLALNSDL